MDFVGIKEPDDSQTKTVVSSSWFAEEEETITRTVELLLILKGETPGPLATKKGPIDWYLYLMFDNKILLHVKWQHELRVPFTLPINLLEPHYVDLVVDKPLVLLLRTSGGKAGKDPDPLAHPDNRAGGTVDLMPLVIGADKIDVKVQLLTPLGEEFGCKVKVFAAAIGPPIQHQLVPLVLTMISAHCFPNVKDNTVYLSAIGLDSLIDDKIAVNFGMSLSSATAKKIVWAGVCTGGQMMNSHYNVPDDDKFIPYDLEIDTNDYCNSVYWNTVKRVLVDPQALRNRLATSFSIELAGVPRLGKQDVRGRYMGLIDARALLHPSQSTLITCAKLRYFVESELPEGIGPLLELPPVSQKSSARSPPICADSQGHTPYAILRLDLKEPLVPKANLLELFNIIGYQPPETHVPLNELYIEPPPEDPSVDVGKIRKECGALAVHKELSNLACRGAVQMNQSIKRTAANRLLTRVRTMLKQFSPGDCSEVDWQDTATGQHAASRRAVNSSFRPQPPPKRVSGPLNAARARMAGDMPIAAKHIEFNLEAYENHPRILLSKALRCLEARNDTEAKFYVLKAIDGQSRNRFLLWLLGGLKFDKGENSLKIAKAAFQIAVKGDYSDAIACTIGWAALHTLYHFEGDQYGAFIAAKKMRKSFELERLWKEYHQNWVDTSGEEEVLWVPGVLQTENPLIIASAFFLCLRCYKFSDLILQCLEQECATRGSRFGLKTNITADLYYLRATSLLLRRRKEEALKLTEIAVKRFGPSSIMSQMRVTCLIMIRGWDDECDLALAEAERSGAVISSGMLLKAASNGMKFDSETALQRAARAHKATPCAHTALMIARIYRRKGEFFLAEKWGAAAVKLEPWLADAWAILALLAMGDRDVDKARAMLRTANQVGPISPEIQHQLKKVMKVVKIDSRADAMTKNLCFCDYLQPSPEKSSKPVN